MFWRRKKKWNKLTVSKLSFRIPATSETFLDDLDSKESFLNWLSRLDFLLVLLDVEDLPPQLICDSFLEAFFVQPITEGLPIVGFPILELETMFQNVLAWVKEASQVTVVFHGPYKVIKNGQSIPCWPPSQFLDSLGNSKLFLYILSRDTSWDSSYFWLFSCLLSYFFIFFNYWRAVYYAWYLMEFSFLRYCTLHYKIRLSVVRIDC